MYIVNAKMILREYTHFIIIINRIRKIQAIFTVTQHSSIYNKYK